MTAIAVVMDLAAVAFFAGFLYLLTRGRPSPGDERPGDEGGRTAALMLIAVSLGLLSVPLWSLP